MIYLNLIYTNKILFPVFVWIVATIDKITLHCQSLTFRKDNVSLGKENN